MVAMVLSCLFLGTAPIAASMAIDRPEAIDDAPGTGRSAAEDGGWAAVLSREEWRVRGPSGLARGVDRQGKKAAGPALRQGDRGVSRPSARSGHQEDAWACPGTGQGRGPGQRCSPAGHRQSRLEPKATTRVEFPATFQATGTDPASHFRPRFRAVRRRSRPRRCGGACWTGPWWLPAWTERRLQLGRDVFARGRPQDERGAGRGGDVVELLRACLAV